MLSTDPDQGHRPHPFGPALWQCEGRWEPAVALASPHCGLKPRGIVVSNGVCSPLTPLTFSLGSGTLPGWS